MKIKSKARDKYVWYLSASDSREPRPLPALMVPMDAGGMTAIECFHSMESLGKMPPCREPLLVEKYIAGKGWHGVTVAMVAEDFAINRIITSEEIKQNYPKWVSVEIFSQAKKIAMERIGFVPTFIANSMDWSEKASSPICVDML